jgi:two-component system C4-dicarboxylate transport response regulator DctD
MTNTVLLVEDDVALLRSIAQSLKLDGIDVRLAGGYDVAEEHISADFEGVVLTDIRLDGKDGYDVLKYAQSCDSDLPVIMLTGHGDIAMAVRAMQLGAFDFLEKPCHPDHMMRVIKKALNHRRLVSRVRELERNQSSTDPAEQSFPGSSNEIHVFREQLRNYARIPINIHIWGEPGSGRHSAGGCIYRLSGSADEYRDMNLVECTTALFNTLEQQANAGFVVFRNVELGTIEQQERLAQFIEQNPNQHIVTTSTHSPDALSHTKLSKSLLLQIGALQLATPSLTTRPEDVLPTFRAIIRQQADSLQMPVPEIPPGRLAHLNNNTWEGTLSDLRKYARKVLFDLDELKATNQKQSLASRTRAHEKSILVDALKRHQGQTAQVALELDIPVKTLYDRLGRHGLKSKDYR